MLALVGRQRLAHRRRCGAVIFTMPETAVRVEGASIRGGGPEATVHVVAEDERLDSASRMFVQEMMVLAGEARAATRHARATPGSHAALPTWKSELAALLRKQHSPRPALPHRRF